MAPFPYSSLPLVNNFLPLVADDFLLRNIWILRRAQSVMQQSGIGKDHPHLKEIAESLRKMVTEAEQRRLSIPEVPYGYDDTLSDLEVA